MRIARRKWGSHMLCCWRLVNEPAGRWQLTNKNAPQTCLGSCACQQSKDSFAFVNLDHTRVARPIMNMTNAWMAQKRENTHTQPNNTPNTKTSLGSGTKFAWKLPSLWKQLESALRHSGVGMACKRISSSVLVKIEAHKISVLEWCWVYQHSYWGH